MLLPRFIKSAYRKDPITSFLLIMGTVDAVIGGVSDRGTLFAFGLMMALTAIALRWIQQQRTSSIIPEEAPVRYLPAGQTQSAIPRLTHEKRRSTY